jgi:hypothetical protein
MQVKMRECNVRKGRKIAPCNGHSKLAHYELLKAVFSLPRPGQLMPKSRKIVMANDLNIKIDQPMLRVH